MKTTSLSELKKELTLLPAQELADICMKLVRYNKENKELLHYLLFYPHNEKGYIESVKEEIFSQFDEYDHFTLFLSTKMIRKILNLTKKYIQYSKQKQTEVELLIYFCAEIKKSVNFIYADKSLQILYQRQIQKINKTIEKLHEDLQHDYIVELNSLI